MNMMQSHVSLQCLIRKLGQLRKSISYEIFKIKNKRRENLIVPISCFKKLNLLLLLTNIYFTFLQQHKDKYDEAVFQAWSDQQGFW